MFDIHRVKLLCSLMYQLCWCLSFYVFVEGIVSQTVRKEGHIAEKVFMLQLFIQDLNHNNS